LVEFVKHNPGSTGCHSHGFFDVLDWLVHSAIGDFEYKARCIKEATRLG
jgi:hypothetical protein